MNLHHRFEPASRAGAPTLLLLHGTGGDEHDLIGLGRLLDDGAALLSPRGAVSEQGASRWFRRLAEGVFDHADLVERTHELAAFVDAARTRYRLGGSPTVAVGFSNGANIAAALLLLRPEILRAAALLAPMLPLPDPPAADLAGVDVFISAGRADPVAPFAQAQDLAGELADRGAHVQLHTHAGGHVVDRASVLAATGWLRSLDLGSPAAVPTRENDH